MRTAIICAVVAVSFAVVGPRIFGPQSHAAGGPFSYEPPDGFVLLDRTKKAEVAAATVWVEPTSTKALVAASPVRVALNHSNKVMNVDGAALAKLAADMPTVFDECAWSHRRHEMRVRADGARVGLIEGDCVHDVGRGVPGIPDQKVGERKLQLMFPDDTGTSIITASYPADQATRWEPAVEATIGKARGVATRVPDPALWIHGAWAVAGAVLGWFGSVLGREREPAPAPPASPKPEGSSARSKRSEDES